MKKQKIITSLLISTTLFCIVFISIVTAEDETTISDAQYDVIDYQSNELISTSPDILIPNLDIRQAELRINGKQAIATIKVYGVIEKRGTLDDFLGDMSEEFDINTVAYSFSIATTVDAYELMYVNNEAFLLFGDGLVQKNITGDSISVFRDTLTIVFDLSTSEETIDLYTVSSQYLKFSFDANADPEDYDELFVYIGDVAPNEDLAISCEVTNLAEAGETVQFIGRVDPLTGQSPFTYHWDFGDGKSSTTINPTHTYDYAGTYEYTFTVKDASDAQVITTGTIQITGGTGLPPSIIIVVDVSNIELIEEDNTKNIPVTVYCYNQVVRNIHLEIMESTNLTVTLLSPNITLDPGDKQDLLIKVRTPTLENDEKYTNGTLTLRAVGDNAVSDNETINFKITTKTPGFELVIGFCALAVAIFLWGKKRIL